MSDLDELKNLLFGAEKRALDSIAARVESREVRASDVADILPEAIHQSYDKNGELVESLTAPVGDCVQRALRDDPETYADALYPVMGPAIRKSIMHALRGFSEQINEAIENSLTPKGLRWRLQASRAGVPFGEFVMQKTLLYRVEQAYLISRENGLLMSHVHHEASKIKDSDAVSAMFTAIQDFVKESFSPDRTGRLESADMGEFTLWAVHGPHALLVCVIRGIPPKNLRAELSAVLERIHFRYGNAIRSYVGDTSSVPGVETELERCLRFEARQAPAAKKSRRIPIWLLAALLLLAGIVYLGIKGWQEAQQLRAFESALAATPGLYVSSVERDDDRLTVNGLRDPLAPTVEAIATDAGIPAERLTVDLSPYQSLEPELIAARAARMFGNPDTVEFVVRDSTLFVSGSAPSAFRQRLSENHRNLAGVDALDDSALMTNDPVPADPRSGIEAATEELDGRRFYFTSGDTFRDDNAAELAEFSQRVADVQQRAAQAGLSLQVSVLGSTDISGTESANARIARSRAEAVAVLLRANGIEIAGIGRASADGDAGRRAVNPDRRFVQIDLALKPPSP